jgi:hypothetical protein
MPYHLIHRFGPIDRPQFSKTGFLTEPQAVIRACDMLADGKGGDFLVENDKGQIITNDVDIRNRCAVARMPKISN